MYRFRWQDETVTNSAGVMTKGEARDCEADAAFYQIIEKLELRVDSAQTAAEAIAVEICGKVKAQQVWDSFYEDWELDRLSSCVRIRFPEKVLADQFSIQDILNRELNWNQSMWLFTSLLQTMTDVDYIEGHLSKDLGRILEASQGLSRSERIRFVREASKCLQYNVPGEDKVSISNLYNTYDPQSNFQSIENNELMVFSYHMAHLWGEDLQKLGFQELCFVLSYVSCPVVNYSDIPYLDELLKIISLLRKESVSDRVTLAKALSELVFKRYFQ